MHSAFSSSAFAFLYSSSSVFASSPTFFSSFFFLLLDLFPFVKSQALVVSVLSTTGRNSGAHSCSRRISSSSGIFTESYNFAAVYNLQPKSSCLSAVCLLFAWAFVNRRRYRPTRNVLPVTVFIVTYGTMRELRREKRKGREWAKERGIFSFKYAYGIRIALSKNVRSKLYAWRRESRLCDS